MRLFKFKIVNYVWALQGWSIKAYDRKQASKLLKKQLATNLSVPAQNSYIKAKNIKLKLIEVSNDC
jgi:hypothetical protein